MNNFVVNDNNNDQAITIDIKYDLVKKNGMVFTIFCRLMIANENLFYQLLQALEQRCNNNMLIKTFFSIYHFWILLCINCKMFLNKFLKFTNNEDKKSCLIYYAILYHFGLKIYLKMRYILYDVQDTRDEMTENSRNIEKQRNKEVSGLEIVKEFEWVKWMVL